MQNNTNFFRNSISLYCCKPLFLSENVTFILTGSHITAIPSFTIYQSHIVKLSSLSSPVASHFFFGRVIPNTVVKTCRGEGLVVRVERVFGFCFKELTFFLQKSSALRSQSTILGGPLLGKIVRCQHLF